MLGRFSPSEHLLTSLSFPRQTECAQMATRIKSVMLFHSLSVSCSWRMVLVSTTCSCSHMWAEAALVEPVCCTQIHRHAPGLCSLLGHHRIPQLPPPGVPCTSYWLLIPRNDMILPAATGLGVYGGGGGTPGAMTLANGTRPALL